MESLEERMRQFTVVVKVALQSGKLRRGGVRRVGEINLLRISIEHFCLTENEYHRCYAAARQLLDLVDRRRGPTSDDLIKQFQQAA